MRFQRWSRFCARAFCSSAIEPLLSITINMSTFGVLWFHWSTMVAALRAPPVIPDWKGSLRMSVQTRTAPTSSPADGGRYKTGMSACVPGWTLIGTGAEAEKGAPVVSTCVIVTGKEKWYTEYEQLSEMSQSIMVATVL